MSVQDTLDKDSEVGKVIRWVRLDWYFDEWKFKYNPELAVMTYKYFYIPEVAVADNCYGDGDTLKYLGRIRDEATVEYIKKEADALVETIEEEGYYTGRFKWNKKPKILAKELYNKIKEE